MNKRFALTVGFAALIASALILSIIYGQVVRVMMSCLTLSVALGLWEDPSRSRRDKFFLSSVILLSGGAEAYYQTSGPTDPQVARICLGLVFMACVFWWKPAALGIRKKAGAAE